MKLEGAVFKYGDNVDTDVIIPARYLNTSDPKELAAHCMEDIDGSFTAKVQPGDIIVLAGKGHEDYQEIEGKKYPMDERVIIRQILEQDKKQHKGPLY